MYHGVRVQGSVVLALVSAVAAKQRLSMSRCKSTGEQRFCLGETQDRRLKGSQTSLAVKHNEVGGARHGRCHACQLLVLHCRSAIVRAKWRASVARHGFCCLCICLKVAEASASVIKSAWRAPSFSTSSALVSILLSPLSRSGEAAGLTFLLHYPTWAEKVFSWCERPGSERPVQRMDFDIL